MMNEDEPLRNFWKIKKENFFPPSYEWKEEEKRRRSREFIDFKELAFPVLLRLNYIRHSIYYLGLLIMFYTYLPTPKKNLFIFQQQQQQPTPLPSVHLFSFFGWMMKEELNGSWKTEGQRTFQAPSKNIDFLLSFYFKESPPLFHFSCVPLP